jgi:hypothetical protein
MSTTIPDLSPRTAAAVAEFVAALAAAEVEGFHGSIGLTLTFNEGQTVKIGTVNEATFPKVARS